MRRLTFLMIGLSSLALAQSSTSTSGTSAMSSGSMAGGSMNGSSMQGGSMGGGAAGGSMGNSMQGGSMNGAPMNGGSMSGGSMSGGSMNGGGMNGGSMAGQTAVTLDNVFVIAAGEGNNFEIEAARVALKNSSNSKVKAFAQKMIDDHTKLGNDVKAALKGDPAMQPPTSVNAAQKFMLFKLGDLKGADFDAAYKNAMVMSHAETYALFSDYIKKGKLANLKRVIEKYAPVVKMHWDMAKTLPST